MSVLLQSTALEITESDSIIGFERQGGAGWKEWDRYLVLDSKRAYHIGNMCETCHFFFERLEGANRSVSPSQVSEALEIGLEDIDSAILNQVSKIMPIGKYRVGLFDVSPRLVTPGTNLDYFTTEQVQLWGLDSFWGFPHHPKTEYYRLGSLPFNDENWLYEFLIPMFPKRWLKKQMLDSYGKKLAEGKKPTALAVSVLDLKGPAEWDESESGPKRHLCLAHYLLDGHHKTYAASLANETITLLSFLALSESIIDEQYINSVLQSFSSSVAG